METAFLDHLANQLGIDKSAACRRAIQRILVRVKERYDNKQYASARDAENEFRKLVERELTCQKP
jgi:hypothetical protein